MAKTQESQKWERLPRVDITLLGPDPGMLVVGDEDGHPVAFVVAGPLEHENWKKIAAAPEALDLLARCEKLLNKLGFMPQDLGEDLDKLFAKHGLERQ